MNLWSATFTAVVALFLVRLSTQWAFVPLFIGASYMTLADFIEIGPFHFTVIRVLLVVGLLRVLVRRERVAGGWNSLDTLMVVWGACAVWSSFFHKDPGGALVYRLGFAYDALGFYFLMRIFIRDSECFLRCCKVIIVVLLPVALEMLVENRTGTNSFAIFGGVSEVSEVRKGRIRAQGPFQHSILAGTVGAVTIPMALALWKGSRRLALLGVFESATMVLTSSSSGPVMATLTGLVGLGLWQYRQHMKVVRWAAVFAVVCLQVVMSSPFYYILSRIDIAGGSTGWHRAALIEASIDHLDEWWFAGTDRTRHWMPTGVPWSGEHTDITNEYLKMGVLGGLPLMLLFIGLLVAAFRRVGRIVRERQEATPELAFLIWTLGTILFVHAVTFISTNYFDQSIIFFQVILAGIASSEVKGLELCTETQVNDSPAGEVLYDEHFCHNR